MHPGSPEHCNKAKDNHNWIILVKDHFTCVICSVSSLSLEIVVNLPRLRWGQRSELSFHCVQTNYSAVDVRSSAVLRKLVSALLNWICFGVLFLRVSWVQDGGVNLEVSTTFPLTEQTRVKLTKCISEAPRIVHMWGERVIAQLVCSEPCYYEMNRLWLFTTDSAVDYCEQ